VNSKLTDLRTLSYTASFCSW